MFFGLFIYWFVVTPTQLQPMVKVGYYTAPLLYVFQTRQNKGKRTKIEFTRLKHTHMQAHNITSYNTNILNFLLHSVYKTLESAYREEVNKFPFHLKLTVLFSYEEAFFLLPYHKNVKKLPSLWR